MSEAAPASNGSAPLLALHSVTKRFGDRVAVDGVSLALRRGEVFGLLGPNGAGKTTLLRMCVDLLRPDTGSLEVLGQPPGAETLARIGYLPEERGLPSRPRVVELLTYLGELKGMPRPEARRQARMLLARVQLSPRERDRVGTLSKGNQQKVQIAAALMGEPEVLLVDEPFSGLDPVNRALVLELFKESVAAGKAVLISTHQLGHVEELCDRLLLINRGRTILEGEVTKVREAHHDGSLYVQADAEGLAALPSVERTAPVGNSGRGVQRVWVRPGATSETVLREALERGVKVRSFAPALPTLEEIFVKVVSASEPPEQVVEALRA